MTMIGDQENRVETWVQPGPKADWMGRILTRRAVRRTRSPAVEDFATTDHLRRDLGLERTAWQSVGPGLGPFL